MFNPGKLLSEVELTRYRETGDLMDAISSDQKRRTICESLGIEMLDSIPKPSPEEAEGLKTLVSPKIGLPLGIVPVEAFANENGELTELKVATSRPLENLPFTILTQMFPSARIRVAFAPKNYIVGALQELYGLGGDLILKIVESGEWDEAVFSHQERVMQIDPNDREATSINYVNHILADAVERRATDIHVEPKPKPVDLNVRYRIDGNLVDLRVPPEISRIKDSIISRLKIMAGLNTAEKRLPQDGRIALELQNHKLDTRVATVPSIEGESIVIRLLGQRTFDLNALQLAPDFLSEIEKLVRISNGIILVTGPTGCGKSTSLFAFLSHINEKHIKIVTIEDPVENKLEDATQIAIKPEVGLTFPAALRSVLRTDPNVIMVGEMRDLETAEIAVRAALTGHLVFSTLHTNDSIAGVTRLIDMGVEPFLVCNAVRAIIAQRLVRRLCTHCKRPKRYPNDYLDKIGFPREGRDQIYGENETGCQRCEDSGYFDRIGIYELFHLTPEIQTMINSGRSEHELRDLAIQNGFATMKQYGWEKVAEGITTIEEVLRATEI